MRSGRVSVVGSANLDHVVRLARAPDGGETVAAAAYTTSIGGKGLNQAVAAARAGAQTQFIAAVGADDAGKRITAFVAELGADVSDVERLDGHPTGTAHVVLEDTGENRIAVVPGANGQLAASWVLPRLRRYGPAVVMLQLESTRGLVTECALDAAAAGARVVLTPAPLTGEPLSADLLGAVGVLALNSGEAEMITGRRGPDMVDALLELVPAIALTLGADGARYADREGTRVEVAGHDVPVVDTTGAGDTFAGWFAASLASGHEPARALEAANAAAAISVGRAGAAQAAPAQDDVLRFVAERLSEPR